MARRSLKAQLPGLLLAMGVGVFAGLGGMKFGSEMLLPTPGSKLIALVPIVTLPLLWLVAVAFHEFGHVVGGWSGGGKFLLFAVGPLMWRRTPAGVRFNWNRHVNAAGGMASCLPLDPALATPRRIARMIAGGPLFSLLLALAALWAAVGLSSTHAPGVATVIFQHMTLFLALLSALIFLVTIAPSTMGGFKSDGRRFYELLRGDARSQHETALLAITAAALAGVRPAEQDAGLMAQAVALKDGSLFDRYAHLTAYSHAADLGEFARAQALLDYVLEGEAVLLPFVRDVVRCEYAWLLATQTTDVVAARAWLDSAGKLEFDPATRYRAEAAVLLHEGHRPEAAEKARAGLHALARRSMSPVKNAFHVDALEELLRRASE